MKVVWAYRLLLCCVLGAGILSGGCGMISAQSSPTSGKSDSSLTPTALEQDFFAAIREGNARKVLSAIR